jgi:altronate dehydratase small subunit
MSQHECRIKERWKLKRCFQVHPADNVATLLDDAVQGTIQPLGTGNAEDALTVIESIPHGHKIALVEFAAGQPVIKFGARIGHTTQPVALGAWVHLHNLASDLDERSGTLDRYSGAPTDNAAAYA